MNLIFATGNSNKVREIRQVLPGRIIIRSLADIGFNEDIPETSDSIEGNSLQKARYLKDHLGVDCFAEDTGLEVACLGGEPGINSARYAGPQRDSNDNMDLLLKKMEGLKDRRAQFKTVITLIIGEEVHQFEGVLRGAIGHDKVGSGGFGYDPIFVLEDGRSLAELDSAEKSAVSHRGIATGHLVEFLQKRYI